VTHSWKKWTDPAEGRLIEVLGRLDELVDWERRDRAPGEGRVMRVDLRPATDLLARLGAPQEAFRAVHVAGSKGKGSTAALVAAGLRRCGVATGVYASPHVERIEERVRLREAPIAPEALAEALETALEAREEACREATAAREATWFDVLTAAAFTAFRTAGIEWAVVECGLGGRLDSTNVLSSRCCVITGIELEHTAILGSTRGEIAAEKAGILLPGVPVVSGLPPVGDEAGEVIARIARELAAPLREVPEARRGTLEERNIALAAAVLDSLAATEPHLGVSGRPIGGWLLDKAVRASAHLPGRMERRDHGGIPVVLDGAHVPSSLAAVIDELAADLPGSGPGIAILALGRDKDASGLLKVLSRVVDRVICTTAGDGPYRAPEELREEALRLSLTATAEIDPREALRQARQAARGGGWVFITGSLHLVGALRRETQDPACSPSSRTCY
jgi:dihydrofolate synthase / folylpolyglutamate synthase